MKDYQVKLQSQDLNGTIAYWPVQTPQGMAPGSVFPNKNELVPHGLGQGMTSRTRDTDMR